MIRRRLTGAALFATAGQDRSNLSEASRLATAACLAAVVLILAACEGAEIDPLRKGLRIENRTAQRLLIYSKVGDDPARRYTAAPTIPPRSTIGAGDPCAAQLLIARTARGELVDRRGPFDQCNLTTWIIRG
jgi:hypothetical protein